MWCLLFAWSVINKYQYQPPLVITNWVDASYELPPTQPGIPLNGFSPLVHPHLPEFQMILCRASPHVMVRSLSTQVVVSKPNSFMSHLHIPFSHSQLASQSQQKAHSHSYQSIVDSCRYPFLFSLFAIIYVECKVIS